jgi:hypothetical protein
MTEQTFITAGEAGRRERAASMIAFAKCENVDIFKRDLEAGQPKDWDDARGSVFHHPGIARAIRVTASVAAQSIFWDADQFDYVFSDKYFAEIREEIARCTDRRMRSKFEAKISSLAIYLKTCPITVEEKRDRSKKLRENTACAIRNLLNFCKVICSEWLTIIPAENFRALLEELERLESAPLAAQLRWFGLSEFVPMEGRP